MYLRTVDEGAKAGRRESFGHSCDICPWTVGSGSVCLIRGLILSGEVREAVGSTVLWVTSVLGAVPSVSMSL